MWAIVAEIELLTVVQFELKCTGQIMSTGTSRVDITKDQ